MSGNLASLIERLEAVESDPIGEGLASNRYRNPDGLEAAATLKAILSRLRNDTDPTCCEYVRGKPADEIEGGLPLAQPPEGGVG